jgi:hypothetical protein
VTDFDAFRRPASAEELARRRMSGLTDRQERHLLNWGYPYVFEDFLFHVTLTGRIEADEAADLLKYFAGVFADIASAPFDLAEIALFAQDSVDVPFYQHRRFKLGAAAGRQE